MEWKQRVAGDMLVSLSEWRLARCICAQFRDRLRASHEQFQAAMRQLEAVHSGRLERTESQRLKVSRSSRAEAQPLIIMVGASTLHSPIFSWVVPLPVNTGEVKMTGRFIFRPPVRAHR